MNALWSLFLWLLALLVNVSQANVADLYNILKCAKPDFDSAILVFYGCYCGPGGDGTPVDDVDTCCQQHDRCYHGVTQVFECSWYIPVLSTVSYACTAGQVSCTDTSLCSKSLCECDSQFARCIQNKTVPTKQPKCRDYFRKQDPGTGLAWLIAK